MKTVKLFFLAIASVVAIGLSACTNENNNPDSKERAEEHNDAKFDNKSEKDAQFIVDAADINLTEMSLGQLAENNATLEDTRELAKMMSRDHKKGYDDLSALAAKKNITIPTAMSDGSKKDHDDLAVKKGAGFDKKFNDMMVDGHKDAIEKFEKASKDAVDPDIQAFAANTLPTLRGHLDHAMSCQEKTRKLK